MTKPNKPQRDPGSERRDNPGEGVGVEEVARPPKK
jgi:hypothetical protein